MEVAGWNYLASTLAVAADRAALENYKVTHAAALPDEDEPSDEPADEPEEWAGNPS